MRHDRYTRRRQITDLAVTLAVYGHGILATARATYQRWHRRHSREARRAQLLVLTLGAVIFVALLIGHIETGPESTRPTGSTQSW